MGMGLQMPHGWLWTFAGLIGLQVALAGKPRGATHDRSPLWHDAGMIGLAVAATTCVGMGWVVLAVRDTESQWLWRGLTLLIVTGWHIFLTLVGWLPLRLALQIRGWLPVEANALALGVALCGADALKQIGWQGHGYALIANSLVDLPGAASWLPWTGSQGLATWICAVIAGGTLLALRTGRRACAGAVTTKTLQWPPAIGLCASLLLYASLALGVVSRGLPAAGDALEIVVVHPPTNPIEGWDAQRRDAGLALVRQALQATPPGGLLVTTEDFFGEPPPVDPQGDWADLLALRDAREAHLLIGMPLWAMQGGEAAVMNAVWQLSPGRNDVFAKQRLVPGAEYLPWSDALALVYRHVFPTAGKRTQPAPSSLARQLQVSGSAVALALCHEVSFALTMAQRADGAQWLLNVADDSWLDSGPYRHQAQNIARLRAMELGKPLLRVVNGSRSVLVSPDGSVSSGVSEPGAAYARFQLGPVEGSTFYQRWAGAWAWAPFALAAALLSWRASPSPRTAPVARATTDQEPSP